MLKIYEINNEKVSIRMLQNIQNFDSETANFLTAFFYNNIFYNNFYNTVKRSVRNKSILSGF